MTGPDASPRPQRWTVRWSVRSRILASILVVAAIGLLVAGATTYLVQRQRTLSDIDNRLVSRVQLARSIVTSPNAGYTNASEALNAILKVVLPNANEGAVGIVDGEPRWKPGVAVDVDLYEDTSLVALASKQVSDGKVWMGTKGSGFGELRYIAVPVTVPGSTQRGVYVTAVSLDAELSTLNSSFGTYAVIAVLALLAIAFVGWLVAGRLLRPIRRLRIAASRITASDLDERIPVVGRDDVSELTGTVNDMLDRLDVAMTSQRQLLDDVRHELKTPLTILRGHLELLDPSTVAEVESTRALALEEIDRMTGLVDDIEALAESRRDSVSRSPIDVADLTREVFAKVSVISDHDWALDGVAEAIASLDPARITQAWVQLADNAAKYSPPGSRIELGSRAVDDVVELWVSDRGPGIPRDSWDRIFERFGRVDTGRGIRGSGLGLPIVQAIARAHGGRVSLASSTAGSRFAIVVPLGIVENGPDAGIRRPGPGAEQA
jgi:two-component system OmpR family sensor kinase